MKPFAAVLALVAASISIGLVHADDRHGKRVALPTIKIEAIGKTCVAPVEDMRKNHMQMLFHQRDRTLRQGVREPRFSLKGCVECHAGRESGSVLGTDGFCSSCHGYASVKIDCFECHSALRQKKLAGKP
jgi:hypothetical protein